MITGLWMSLAPELFMLNKDFTEQKSGKCNISYAINNAACIKGNKVEIFYLQG